MCRDCTKRKPQMNTDLCLSVPTNPKILCWQERIFLREIRALRGFAVNPGLDFHREGAKHAKKTRRTLVWLRLCRSVFICGFICASIVIPGIEQRETFKDRDLVGSRSRRGDARA